MSSVSDEGSLSVSDAVRGRISARAFLPEPVPDAMIREVFDLARLAPSNSNTQPWHVAVVSGAARDEIERRIFAAMDGGDTPNPTWPSGGVGLKGEYKQRQRDCAAGYYSAMGIDYEDKRGRTRLALQNWRFFGAPHAAFFSMPDTMHRANAVDLGIFLQTVMLLLEERGIDSCAQGALASWPDQVRAVAPIPDGNAILVGMSFGYRDGDAAANTVRMDRLGLDDIASFVSDLP